MISWQDYSKAWENGCDKFRLSPPLFSFKLPKSSGFYYTNCKMETKHSFPKDFSKDLMNDGAKTYLQ